MNCKKANATQNEVNLLNSEVSAVNQVTIDHAIKNAFNRHNKMLNVRFRNVIDKLADLKDPIEKQIQDIRAESEGHARQSNHFVKLYRQCLAEFKKEVDAKQQILKTQNTLDYK